MIVPGAVKAVNVEDKDGNGVYRIIAYKDQAEDVVKACRKLSIPARIFEFDMAKWQDDKKTYGILQETYQNKTNTLHKLASD